MRPDESRTCTHRYKRVQYLYSQDGVGLGGLRNIRTIRNSEETIEQELKYILENMEAKIQFYGSEAIGVVLQVTETQTIN